jgi:CDP-glucose 4,6-dehydratase
LEDRHLNTAFWEGKSVLITGHTGFKGSWLSLWLDRLGAKVSGLSLDPPSEPNLFDQAGVTDAVSDGRGDIRDPKTVAAALKNAEPEVVFHFAAQSLVRTSYEQPLETYSTNVMGTAVVLEALGETPSARVAIIATTDKCYLNLGDGRRFKEDDPLGGNDHYSASKAAAEHVAASYRKAGKHGSLRSATVRAGNVLGGGDWARDRLVPDLVRSAQGSPARLRNPSSVRPWQHVLDCLHGYILLTEALWEDETHQGAWNFGPDEEPMTAEAVAERSARLWPERIRWVTDDSEQPPEAATLALDATKARERLGWQPLLPMSSALPWTIEWYRRVSEAEDPRSLTTRQLDEFGALVRSGGA